MLAKLGTVTLLIATTIATGVQQSQALDIAAICFLKGEQESDMNRICYYDCLSGTVAITIKDLKLCPLTIDE